MNQLRTTGIVLSRVEYGEADRIITVLTSDTGKISLMAKGVRRVKSKLAGGIELFSVSEIVYMPSKSNLQTLISARLITHFSHIVEDINRTMAAYDVMKQIHKTTEEDVEEAYFLLLQNTLQALNEKTISLELVQSWCGAQLLKLSGHMPNLSHDIDGNKLLESKTYEFDFEMVSMKTIDDMKGSFDSNKIKFFRLLFAASTPTLLAKIEGNADFARQLNPLVTTLRQFYLSV